MRSATLFGLAVCLIVPMSVGCMNQHGIVRGQSPETRGPGVTPAGGFYGDTSGGVQQVGFYNGPSVATTSSLSERMGYSTCRGHCDRPCSDNCPPRPCDNCPTGCPDGWIHSIPGAWYPTHQHSFCYDAPQNLVYPPSNVPPANIVYPYYTCKGPDDFFKAY